MNTPKPIAAGNWKMNGLLASEAELNTLANHLKNNNKYSCEVLICPPFTLLKSFAEKADASGIQIGAQDCHPQVSGAHTGDTSAQMIKDAGCSHVIVGHSERRADHGESDFTVCSKAKAGHVAGLIAIVCVGETEAERDSGKTAEVVLSQLAGSVPADATAQNTVVAYEPVWAIGTGRTPTSDEVGEIHTTIREALVKRFGADGEGFRLLYGGSVKPSNAEELMNVANVNGALVGGASLKADDFNGIIDAYR
jgi:triosephosphate isomerase